MKIMKEKLGLFRNLLSLGSSLFHKEEAKHLKGELFLKAYENGKLVQEYNHHNIIVNTASLLIASLLKGDTTTGITYLALGSGSASWPLLNPPAPSTTQTLLENEFFRKKIDFTTYIDPSSGQPTQTPTNIVDYSVSLSESEGVGTVLELALFGNSTATSAINSGVMVNWRTIPCISKTNTMTLIVTFRITT